MYVWVDDTMLLKDATKPNVSVYFFEDLIKEDLLVTYMINLSLFYQIHLLCL